MIIKCLFISTLMTIAVFSIGTRNAGTAIRHRDKVILPLIIITAVLYNKYLFFKWGNRLRRREWKNGKTY